MLNPFTNRNQSKKNEKKKQLGVSEGICRRGFVLNVKRRNCSVNTKGITFALRRGGRQRFSSGFWHSTVGIYLFMVLI